MQMIREWAVVLPQADALAGHLFRRVREQKLIGVMKNSFRDIDVKVEWMVGQKLCCDLQAMCGTACGGR